MLAAHDTRLDRLALLTGVAVAAFLLLTWRVDGGTQPPAATVEVVTRSTAELAVTPAGVTSERTQLAASSRAGGFVRTLRIRNATGSDLQVSVRAVPDVPDLDESLMVALAVRGGTVYRGTLATLRRGTPTFPLASHEEAPLELRVWIPESAPAADWRARAATIEVSLATESAS